MPKKSRTAPTFHTVPTAFVKAATVYLSSAILSSDRPIAKLFTAVKQGKQVARGLITKSIDEIQLLEEKRKLKLMMAGNPDPAPDPMPLKLIALLESAIETPAAAAAAEPAAAATAIETPAAAAAATPENAIAPNLTTPSVEPNRVIPSPKPRASPKKTAAAIQAPLEFDEDSNFRQFFALKVPGGGEGDKFSRMKLGRLLAQLGDRAAAVRQEIEALWQGRNDADGEAGQLPYDTLALGRVLRWHLRGLSINAAVKKVRVNLEVTQRVADREAIAREATEATEANSLPVSV